MEWDIADRCLRRENMMLKKVLCICVKNRTATTSSL